MQSPTREFRGFAMPETHVPKAQEDFMTSFMLLLLALATNAQAHSGAHVPHQLLLYGQEEVFASHIIAPSPHHHQLILKIKLPVTARDLLKRERASHPGQSFIYRLEAMDLGEFGVQTELRGRLQRIESSATRVPLIEDLRIPKDHVEIIYHAELPLSLAPKANPQK